MNNPLLVPCKHLIRDAHRVTRCKRLIERTSDTGVYYPEVDVFVECVACPRYEPRERVIKVGR